MVNISKLRADLEEALPPMIARAKTEYYPGGLYKQKQWLFMTAKV